MSDYSLYLHIPFCRHKCSYCDFNTYAGKEALVGPYVEALCREISLISQAAGARLGLDTVFFGGGTPSGLSLEALGKILAAIETNFFLKSGVEITLEANPGRLKAAYLQGLRGMGINRLSLGMQSANQAELALLERQHDHYAVIQAVKNARLAGFRNLNVDLIFGLPHQTIESWERTLVRALDLKPEHFSLYALSVEHGTPLESWVQRGLLRQPNADLAAEMYERAGVLLQREGYSQYEISNWSQAGDENSGFECRHNLQYWRNQPYLGLGAGAHGFVAGYRTANVLGPEAYIRRCGAGNAAEFPRTPATASLAPIDLYTEMQETLLMGLRLTQEGISRTRFRNRFGRQLEEVFPREIEELLKLELLTWVGDQKEVLRLTGRGRLLGNQVFMHFV